MEHVQPIERTFSRRAAALAVAILLATALAIAGGLVLLRRGDRTSPEQTRPGSDTGRVPAGQVAAAALRPRSRVSVLVLNGNGVTGAAGDEASRLLAKGYRHALAADATTGYATSLVLFRRGWEGEAKRLAHDARIRTVAPLDGSLPSADAGYRLVVILGAR